MALTIYHNPRCAKSRATLALLEARGLRPTVVEYLKTPPSPAKLKHILKLLHVSARELLRAQEPEYKAAGLDKPNLSDEKIVAAMVKHPILIERPIVVAGAKAALGRPPEKVLEIL